MQYGFGWWTQGGHCGRGAPPSARTIEDTDRITSRMSSFIFEFLSGFVGRCGCDGGGLGLRDFDGFRGNWGLLQVGRGELDAGQDGKHEDGNEGFPEYGPDREFLRGDDEHA